MIFMFNMAINYFLSTVNKYLTKCNVEEVRYISAHGLSEYHLSWWWVPPPGSEGQLCNNSVDQEEINKK